MEKLEHKRHTLAHLLAAAVLEFYPNAKLTLGPAIEEGFYYDIDFGDEKLNEEDLKKIEGKMRKILPSWKEFSHKEVSKEEAEKYYAGNQYKLEMIRDIDEKITLYTISDFTDLCRGGHTENPASDISSDSFTLDRIAGAYWRGNENNTMLTRIYGLAFDTKAELDLYKATREEAKKRDHRKLGKELDLFTFSDLVGPGLPLWTPNGTLVRHLLDNYVWSMRKAKGYEKVEIPHITKKELYEKSGHWQKFKDELFLIKTREGHEFAMKPMNCPHHTQIFARQKWSYRDMPKRYANTTTCYRDEQTGELHGLSRVRAFAQDDAHVFCREDQVKEEAFNIWDIIEAFYKTFNFELKVRLSIHDPIHMEKYLGDEESWDSAVKTMKDWLSERNVKYTENPGEAAFYGPKIDFIAKDSLGREWQVATIQIDRNMPKNFDLVFTNKNGEEEGVVMIHAAIMGSLERFLSILLEHTNGRFPLWLSPIQIAILPVSNEKHGKFAQELSSKIADIRTTLDDSNDTLGKKIRNARASRAYYQLVIGDKEIESGVFILERYDGEKETFETIEELNKSILEKIEEKD